MKSDLTYTAWILGATGPYPSFILYTSNGIVVKNIPSSVHSTNVSDSQLEQHTLIVARFFTKPDGFGLMMKSQHQLVSLGF